MSNSGSFTHRGIEFAGHYRPTEQLSINANYSYIEPDQQTYTTPKHKLYVGLNYTYDKISLNLALQHIAVLYGADGSQERLPDYTLLGARVSYQAAEFINIYVSGENLFNISYETIYDYPMPGRALLAGFSLRLGVL